MSTQNDVKKVELKGTNNVGMLSIPKAALAKLEDFWKDINGKQVTYVQPIQVGTSKRNLVANIVVCNEPYHIPRSWIKELPKAKEVDLSYYTEENQEILRKVFTQEELKAFVEQEKHLRKTKGIGKLQVTSATGKSFEVVLAIGNGVGVRIAGSSGGFQVIGMNYYQLLVELQCSPTSVVIIKK